MSRNTKILVAVVAGLLLLACLCAATVAAGVALFSIRSSSVSVSPNRVEEAAVRVDGFAPEGWRAEGSSAIGRSSSVGFRAETPRYG